jgi:hypothetical protein
VIEAAGEEAELRFKNCDRQGKEPLKPAIDIYLENFADGLQIIYNQLDDDHKYMELVTKCRKLPLNQPPNKNHNHQEEEKKGNMEKVYQSKPEDLLEPLKQFQELFDEQLKLQESGLKIIEKRRENIEE